MTLNVAAVVLLFLPSSASTSVNWEMYVCFLCNIKLHSTSNETFFKLLWACLLRAQLYSQKLSGFINVYLHPESSETPGTFNGINGRKHSIGSSWHRARSYARRTMGLHQHCIWLCLSVYEPFFVFVLSGKLPTHQETNVTMRKI